MRVVAVALVVACSSSETEPRVRDLHVSVVETPGGRELRVQYRHPALQQAAIDVLVHARCRIGDQVMLDDTTALRPLVATGVPNLVAYADEIDTKLFDGFVHSTLKFDGPKLPAEPSVCEITIGTHPRSAATTKLLVEACARVDHPPAPGRCSEGTFPR